MQTLKLCKNCGHTVCPKRVTPGHFLIEVILWLCMIIPGLIYSIWRIASRYEACPVCGVSGQMIPADSPAAKTKA